MKHWDVIKILLLISAAALLPTSAPRLCKQDQLHFEAETGSLAELPLQRLITEKKLQFEWAPTADYKSNDTFAGM